MRYDPNTASNCFYTADMSSYNIFAATATGIYSNYTRLYTQNSNLFKPANTLAAYSSRYVGIFELKDSKKYP